MVTAAAFEIGFVLASPSRLRTGLRRGKRAPPEADKYAAINWVCSGFASCFAAINWVCFGFVWVRLGSFWVCFWAAEGGGIVVTLLHETCCVDFGSFQDWVRLYKKGPICRGLSTEIELVGSEILDLRCAIQDLMFTAEH